MQGVQGAGGAAGGGSSSSSMASMAGPPGGSTLEVLRRVPGNAACCDCGAADPDWASLNLGEVQIVLWMA